MSLTSVGLLGARSSSEIIVVPVGTSPIFITLPTISCVDDCIANFSKRTFVWIATPWATDSVGFVIMKLIVMFEFTLTIDG